MALEEICGITKETGSRRSGAPDFERYLKEYSSNLDNPYCLSAPPFKNPMENMQKFVSDGACGGIKINYDHGTTTLGFKFQGGVVLAVDSRATGGQFIGSQGVKKVVEINKYLLATMAGGAADCVYWDRVLARECRLYELRNKDRISVAAASKIMSNLAFGYKGTGLSMGMMLAGYDKRGPGLYYVDSDGSRSPGNVFSVGSGSIYALGVLDTAYKWDLKDEEAFELGRRAIYHATYRDAYSGGIVRVYHMTANGWVNISNTDCMDLHFKYEAEKKAAEGEA